MTPEQRLGERIRILREFHGMSQERLGKLLGVHQAAVCRIERGEQQVTAVQLEVIRIGFDPGLTLDEFFEPIVETVAVDEEMR